MNAEGSRNEIDIDTDDLIDGTFNVGLYWRWIFQPGRLVRLAGWPRSIAADYDPRLFYASEEVSRCPGRRRVGCPQSAKSWRLLRNWLMAGSDEIWLVFGVSNG